MPTTAAPPPRFHTFSERPDADHWALIERAWPRFVVEASPASPEHRPDWFGATQRWPHLQSGLWDGDQLIASFNTCPVRWDASLGSLPEAGWDWALHQAARDASDGRTPNTLVGLAVTIAPERRGEGLARVALEEMKATATRAGLDRVLIPVRPPLKARYPLIPMSAFIRWTRDDGLPLDPWLRVHARAGGEVLRPCGRSMTLGGDRTRWAEWLGLELPGDGDYVGPDLLAPLQIRGARGLYVEPNVWVLHRT